MKSKFNKKRRFLNLYVEKIDLTFKPPGIFKRGIIILPDRWELMINSGGEYIID